MFEIITIDDLLGRLEKYNYKELHVHHTYQPDHSDFNGSNGLALQKGMRNYHVNTRGWQDIGQHVTLLPDGRFITGRDFGKSPASISGYNTGAFACEMLGNFDTGHDKLEGAQKESMLRLAKYFDDKGKYIRFHRENSPKTCPGSSIDKETFIKEVRAFGKESADKNTSAAESKLLKPTVREAQAIFNTILKTDLVLDNIPGPKTYAAASKVVLEEGSNNDAVKWLQRMLNYLGYNSGAVDGIFGLKTLTALKAFQWDNDLTAVGIVGVNTWKTLLTQ